MNADKTLLMVYGCSIITMMKILDFSPSMEKKEERKNFYGSQYRTEIVVRIRIRESEVRIISDPDLIRKKERIFMVHSIEPKLLFGSGSARAKCE
jgi:hypothetical protein